MSNRLYIPASAVEALRDLVEGNVEKGKPIPAPLLLLKLNALLASAQPASGGLAAAVLALADRIEDYGHSVYDWEPDPGAFAKMLREMVARYPEGAGLRRAAQAMLDAIDLCGMLDSRIDGTLIDNLRAHLTGPGEAIPHICPEKHGAEREMELQWVCETCGHRESAEETSARDETGGWHDTTPGEAGKPAGPDWGGGIHVPCEAVLVARAVPGEAGKPAGPAQQFPLGDIWGSAPNAPSPAREWRYRCVRCGEFVAFASLKKQSGEYYHVEHQRVPGKVWALWCGPVVEAGAGEEKT